MKERLFRYGAYVFALAGLLSAACSAHSSAKASLTPTPTPTVATATAAVPSAQDEEAKVPRVSVDELKKLRAAGKVVVLDVRSIDSYKAGHIKGAVLIPLNKLEAGDFTGLPRDKRIVAYCDCPTEHSSARAGYVLQKAGFKEVGALLGGTGAWEKAGGEMEKGAPAAKP